MRIQRWELPVQTRTLDRLRTTSVVLGTFSQDKFNLEMKASKQRRRGDRKLAPQPESIKTAVDTWTRRQKNKELKLYPLRVYFLPHSPAVLHLCDLQARACSMEQPAWRLTGRFLSPSAGRPRPLDPPANRHFPPATLVVTATQRMDAGCYQLFRVTDCLGFD